MIDSEGGRCNANVPFHLPDALEYKFLGCIPDHHQLRMASNGIRMAYRSHPYNAARAGLGGGRPVWLFAGYFVWFKFFGGFEPHGFRDPQEFLFPQTKMRLIRPGAWLRGLQAEGPGKENRIMSREPRKRHQ